MKKKLFFLSFIKVSKKNFLFVSLMSFLLVSSGLLLSYQLVKQKTIDKRVLQATTTLTTVTIYPTDDSYVSDQFQNLNFGTQPFLITSAAAPRDLVYLKFDLTPFAGKTITGATLQVTNANTFTGSVDVRAMTNTTWTESSLTYTNKPATYASNGIIDGGVLGGVSSTDVTADVQKNTGNLYSLRLEDKDDLAEFYSRETGTTTAPKLVITYDPGSTYISIPTPTPNIFVSSGCSAFASDVVIAIDQSLSVQSVWNQIAAAANSFIDQLSTNPQNHISVISFADIGYIRTHLSNDFAASKNAVSSLTPIDGTCVQCGTEAVADEIYQNGRQNTQKIAIILTDAQANKIIIRGNGRGRGQTKWNKDWISSMNAAIDEGLVTYNRDGTRFYTIGYRNAAVPLALLSSLAKQTGGKSYYAPDPGTITNALSDVAKIIGTGNGTIAGKVYDDKNRNGKVDGGDVPLPGWEVDMAGGTSGASASLLTDSTGSFNFPGLCDATYKLSQNPKPGWIQTLPLNNSPYYITITNGSDYAGKNFLLTQGYSISGNVFNDVNKNKIKDTGEVNITGAKVSASGGSTTVTNGAYTVTGLPAGTYTVSYKPPLPPGYEMIYPKNATPPSFSVTVGPGCKVDGTTGGACTSGNINNLNFAVTNSIPWMQTYNFDARFDNGYNDVIPQTPVYPPYAIAQNAQAASPGILFTGNGFTNLGNGQASSKKWSAGGTVYPEVYTSSGNQTLVTYNALLAKAKQGGLQITDLSTKCSVSNCTLPANLSNGIYQAKGNLVLNGYTFPANKNYVILVANNLTIKGNLTVPNGSTATYATGGSIAIDKGVGVTPVSPLPQGQVQGIFSAGKDFVVQGTDDCIVGEDNMLNIEGTVLVNALQGGGTFTNQRDLCSDNLSYPAVTIKGRADFILNMPTFLTQQKTVSREVAP